MTEQTQPEPTGTVISERDQRRIVAPAMMKMPYAAAAASRSRGPRWARRSPPSRRGVPRRPRGGS